MEESRDSWIWFLVKLRDALSIDDLYSWTFMSDRQKGIVEAVSCCMPGANHRFCLRHLYSNFKKLFKGKELKDVVWVVGKSYTQTDFVRYMEVIKSISRDAFEWLSRIPPDTWSKHGFDPLVKSNDIINNWTESFNAWIGEARAMPIVEMLKDIRKRWMQKIYYRHKASIALRSDLLPKVQAIIDKRSREARAIKKAIGRKQGKSSDFAQFWRQSVIWA
uniref:MULE transposase domain-containing protein n=1 Tax=Nelumbo nucifera TaxID=4432 RepID=A0A822XPP3_NELNU|nr:TPA_asm: hypothetical protein HUJ06_022512 [Nelumbo nucifera]